MIKVKCFLSGKTSGSFPEWFVCRPTIGDTVEDINGKAEYEIVEVIHAFTEDSRDAYLKVMLKQKTLVTSFLEEISKF